MPELLAIKNENIDFENNTLLISGSIVWDKNNNENSFGIKDTTNNEGSY
ncbi:hypothetical protein [Macrococcoides bohemicum]|nr:hypothetical protein [Macrococcus bohemicus]MBC9873318.1 hypothetical protein [Macrococcus bohemicus]